MDLTGSRAGRRSQNLTGRLNSSTGGRWWLRVGAFLERARTLIFRHAELELVPVSDFQPTVFYGRGFSSFSNKEHDTDLIVSDAEFAG